MNRNKTGKIRLFENGFIYFAFYWIILRILSFGIDKEQRQLQQVLMNSEEETSLRGTVRKPTHPIVRQNLFSGVLGSRDQLWHLFFLKTLVLILTVCSTRPGCFQEPFSSILLNYHHYQWVFTGVRLQGQRIPVSFVRIFS